MAETRSRIFDRIEAVPWGQLAHAHGFAKDAPRHLARFFDASGGVVDDDLEKAIDWMWGAVLHQGNIYSASVPAVSILVELLDLEPDHPQPDEIALFVDTIAEGVGDIPIKAGSRDDSAGPVLASSDPLFEAWIDPGVPLLNKIRSVLKRRSARYLAAAQVRREVLLKLLEEALPVLNPLLGAHDPEVQECVVGALSRAAGIPELADHECVAGLKDLIGDERVSPQCWVSIATSLRQPPIDLLGHADWRIRLAAAMHPAMSDNLQALEQLVQALNDVESLRASFPRGVPTLYFGISCGVLQTVLRRVEAEQAEPHVVDAICNLLAKEADDISVDRDWGPCVAWAFAERRVKLPIADSKMEALPTALTHAQRSILETLVANDDVWDPKFGNASLAYREFQLPYDRKILKRLLRESDGLS